MPGCSRHNRAPCRGTTVRRGAADAATGDHFVAGPAENGAAPGKADQDSGELSGGGEVYNKRGAVFTTRGKAPSLVPTSFD
ncbi:hypothetical protein NDU88_002143 [Pleurodeles waltl]|uniref:Uncharacterized protein n=1 Tax=Pleurodeles waltl TaxID=8319 RepID=A0AAV7KRE8_PLEWA|nr:hypothetical protein NDU88_002143 [Pleurodeles waltl]